MKTFSLLFSLWASASQAAAQLVINQVDINQLNIEYCQLICNSSTRPRVYIDYGQANFRENSANELRNLDEERQPTERFGSVMQAVNFVEKNGWEVVSFQVTHTGAGSPSEFIYLMRRKRRL